MVQNKTQPTKQSVTQFLAGLENPQRKKDAKELLNIFKELTGEKAVMWGESLIGFGNIHYKYASGREGDWMATGFSPRKGNLSLYVLSGIADDDPLLGKLGPHKRGKACLYIKSLEEIHLPTLKKIIKKSFAHSKKTQKMC
jgi:hypothetical protein